MPKLNPLPPGLAMSKGAEDLGPTANEVQVEDPWVSSYFLCVQHPAALFASPALALQWKLPKDLLQKGHFGFLLPKETDTAAVPW